MSTSSFNNANSGGLVGRRPSHTELVRKDPNILTAQDVSTGKFVAPIFDTDMDDKSVLERKIYVANFSGRIMNFLATPLGVQIHGEDDSDPDNYDMLIREILAPNEFFCFDVPNTIWFSYSVVEPPNRYIKGEPSAKILQPNGKVLDFFLRQDSIKWNVVDDANVSPNCLIIRNHVPGTKVLLNIFTKDPLMRPPSKQLKPDWTDIVVSDKYSHYQHIVDYTCWIADCLDVKPLSAESGRFSASNSFPRSGGTDRFEVGSIKYWDVVQAIPPGTYLIICVSSNDSTSRYVIVGKDWRNVRLIRKSQYFVNS